MTLEKFRIRAIHACALRFRAAIEQCNRLDLPYAMESFPSGSCGIATLLLGGYLTDEGFGRFEYMVGEHRDASGLHSHVWMRQGTVVVDITADQFSTMENPVIVSGDSAWHGRLRQDSDGVADFRLFDQQTEKDLLSAYNSIVEQLEPVPALI